MNLMNDMKMINRLFPMAFSALLLGLLFSPALVAQPDGRPGGMDREALRERVEVVAVGFLTEELELDAESAQIFWPIYNTHKEEAGPCHPRTEGHSEGPEQFRGWVR